MRFPIRLAGKRGAVDPPIPSSFGCPKTYGHCCGNRSRVDSLDGLRRLWNEHDVIAQAAQALDHPGGGALTRDLIEVALAEVTEGLAGGQHVEHGDEQL